MPVVHPFSRDGEFRRVIHGSAIARGAPFFDPNWASLDGCLVSRSVLRIIIHGEIRGKRTWGFRTHKSTSPAHRQITPRLVENQCTYRVMMVNFETNAPGVETRWAAFSARQKASSLVTMTCVVACRKTNGQIPSGSFIAKP
jgi:hypothetical protein